jgi:hypothetical protein
MRGDELVNRLWKIARRDGYAFRFDPGRGKGSHGTVWLDKRFAVVPAQGAKEGYAIEHLPIARLEAARSSRPMRHVMVEAAE